MEVKRDCWKWKETGNKKWRFLEAKLKRKGRIIGKVNEGL